MIAIKVMSTGRCLAQHPNVHQHLVCLNAQSRNSIIHQTLLSSSAQVNNCYTARQCRFASTNSATNPTNHHANDKQANNKNNQRLITIARNIYFRQCNSESSQVDETNKKALDYSYAHPYVSTASNSEVFGYPTQRVQQELVDESSSQKEQQSRGVYASNFNSVNHFSSPQQQQQQQQQPLSTLASSQTNSIIKNDDDDKEGNTTFYGQSFDRALTMSDSQSEEPKLVVLMSWLEASEKHIEKYRQYYLKHGYDVLNVKTSPFDILLPAVGAKKIAIDFVKFLAKNNYEGVVLHSFSVGGYQFGEFVLEVEKQEQKTKERILNSIKGLVFDSPVPIEGVGVGVSRSITNNKLIAKFIQGLLELYLLLGKHVATKYYRKVSEKVWAGPLSCPALFFYSKDDLIADFQVVKNLPETWKRLGIEVQQVVFDSSPHVQHFQTHHKQYTSKLQQFLKAIKFD